MKCSGLHCPGCGHRGGNTGIGAGAVTVLIVVAVIVANRCAIGHAASVTLHVLEIAAEVAAGLAVTTGITASVLVIRRWAARRRATATAATAAPQRAEIPASVRVLSTPRRTPAELPAPEPSRRFPWPYATRDGRRAQ